MTRYHINPSNKVLRCNAQSSDACPYGSKAHFEGDSDQAKFMQDALDRNLKKSPPKAKSAPPADNFSFSSMGDALSARQQEDGTYAIYTRFNNEEALIEENIAPLENRVSFVRHLGQVARSSGYAGHVIDTAYQKEDPDVTQVREVRESGTVIGYLAQKQGGWIALRRLSELKSRPIAAPGTGVILAAFKLRKEVAQQIRLIEARERGLARAAEITAKVDLMEPLKRSLESARKTSPYPPLKSATTKPPFPYGPGSGQ